VSKPFDAVSKELLQLDPAGWAAFLGVVRPADRVVLRDSELSTVTAAADKVLVIEDDPPWIIDVEFQSSREPSVPRQLLKYNALLHDRHKLPVASVLVVLTREADSPVYSGRYSVAPPLGPRWEFGYTVMRVWEVPAEALLNGPLALTPLAPVANAGREELPGLVRRVSERAGRECDPETSGRLLTAVGILLTMRYGEVATNDLLSQFPEIRDMAPFKKFIEEGRAKGLAEGRAEGRVVEARAVLLRHGEKRFGSPPSQEQAAIVDAITDITRLRALDDRVPDVSTWDELLKTD
jgi:predicted transposase YdaD